MNSGHPDELAQLHQKVGQVRDVALDNIHKAAANIQGLQAANDDTTIVLEEAKDLEKTAKKAECWERVKLWRMYIYIVLALIIIAIVVAVVAYTQLKGDDNKSDSNVSGGRNSTATG